MSRCVAPLDRFARRFVRTRRSSLCEHRAHSSAQAVDPSPASSVADVPTTEGALSLTTLLVVLRGNNAGYRTAPTSYSIADSRYQVVATFVGRRHAEDTAIFMLRGCAPRAWVTQSPDPPAPAARAGS